MNKKKQYTPEFKAKVVMESYQGGKEIYTELRHSQRSLHIGINQIPILMALFLTQAL